MNNLSVIFPFYNEEERIDICLNDIKNFYDSKKIKKKEFILVNDGSKDQSLNKIKKFIKKNKNKSIKIINLKKNFGKGYALKKGVFAAKFKNVLTIDSDISVSLSQLNFWLKFPKFNSYEIIFGSRNLKQSKIKYSLNRFVLGFFFRVFIRYLLKINITDTQCGFKLYKNNTAKKIFKLMQTEGFSHDIEIVLIAKKLGFKISEYPVEWIHKNNSKLRIVKDSINMLIEIFKIKKIFK